MALLAAGAAPVASIADPLPPIRLQGSTTFAAEILGPYGQSLERTTGRSLEVVANKSSWGLFALLEGRVDVAMISAPLASEIVSASKLKPGLAYDTLQEFRIATTRIAFVVNQANPLTRLTIASVGRILTGEITNWRDVGGDDKPIRVVAVKEGGGTVVAARASVFGEAPFVSTAVRLESANHVVKVVVQDTGAIGIAQLGLIRTPGLHEIVVDTAVEQPLSFVTRGDPSPSIVRIIDAARMAAANAGN